jgi:elongation factor Ts
VEIKATDVKALRDKTGAGMMDCKKALLEAGGNFDRAERILKELGLAAARKRAGRQTRAGRVFSKLDEKRGALLELDCETDFVAMNKDFIALGQRLTGAVLEGGTQVRREELDSLVQQAVGVIKENIELRRYGVLEAGPQELLVNYIHGEGNIGVLLKFTLSDSKLKESGRVREVAFDLTLHTAAFAPLFLSRAQVPAAYLEEQEGIFAKQAAATGKPDNVVKGITAGKLNKHLAGVCLVDQAFVKDQDLKVSKVLESLGKEVGGKVEISDYLYYRVGEEGA